MKSLAICATGIALAIIAAGVLSSEPAAAQQASTPADIDQSNGRTLDEQLLDVARRDPAFGGMFFDNDGRLTMYVLKSTLAAQDGNSRLAGMSLDVESAFRDHPMMEPASTMRMNVREAEYSFVDLYGWHEALRSDVLGLPGVVLTDIAEDQNRLRVGVESASAGARVRQRLASLGVPGGSVRIELTTPMQRLASVRNQHSSADGRPANQLRTVHLHAWLHGDQRHNAGDGDQLSLHGQSGWQRQYDLLSAMGPGRQVSHGRRNKRPRVFHGWEMSAEKAMPLQRQRIRACASSIRPGCDKS